MSVLLLISVTYNECANINDMNKIIKIYLSTLVKLSVYFLWILSCSGCNSFLQHSPVCCYFKNLQQYSFLWVDAQSTQGLWGQMVGNSNNTKQHDWRVKKLRHEQTGMGNYLVCLTTSRFHCLSTQNLQKPAAGSPSLHRFHKPSSCQIWTNSISCCCHKGMQQSHYTVDTNILKT